MESINLAYTGRIKVYDYMKAFAIFLVVMDHTITLCDDVDNGFRTFIYSIHMPLFFIVSGFLASKKRENYHDLWKFYSGKFRLVIPLFVFGVADSLLLGHNFNEFLEWGKFGLWFLWALFLFFTVYSISQALFMKSKRMWVDIASMIVVSLVLIILRKYSETTIGGIFNFLNMYNYCFFVLGVIISRYNLKRTVIRDDVQFLMLVIYVIGLGTGFSFLNIPMKACGILFIYGCFDKLINSKSIGGGKINDAICLVGQNSLYIYIIHYYFIIGLEHLPENIHSFLFISPAFYLPFYTCISCFIIAACMVIKNVVYKNKYVRICLGGK